MGADWWVTHNENGVKSHPPGSRFECADGRVHVVDSVEQAVALIDTDVPGLNTPVWVVNSHPAETTAA
jgi:hypothetical protein